MQIVLDIPDSLYENILICWENIHPKVWKILKDGTVLPKGHGKIIGEPTEEDMAKTIGGQNDFAECIREAVKAVFDNAPTIIEADKEVENG